ncbi:glycoside hydrolase family 2 TIM barrel-domain containing protein [uncultured Bacteroides sp.]|uniref:glycoside hydrolase family 2 TIM barrel-domain containing protein n=1 Tax=uncultured Bacteroides sp. TaxID=162156 RepID=UPI0035A6F2DA
MDMNRQISLLAVMALLGSLTVSIHAQRTVTTLNEGWEFTKGRPGGTTKWQKVRVPHDWAIYGPFNRANDLQTVAVEQNGETEKTEKTGRTGGLPFIGQGTYRTTFEIADTVNRNITIVFDGAMSNAHVKVNGKEVAYWPYGYNSFYADVSDAVVPGNNDMVVELENFERASRWYPGAGLYRNVHVVNTNKVHIPTWGTYVTTPFVSTEKASVRLEMDIVGAKKGEKVNVNTEIVSPEGIVVASNNAPFTSQGQMHVQNFLISDPELWSPECPRLYTARTSIEINGQRVDNYATRFGVRKIEYIPEQGFFLNGRPTKFRGVCNHHDLGPLGAAVNKSALRHQVELMKDMGANAIRTSHNMPAPELVELCDELGMMLMIEPFDDWGFRPKSPNGYGAFFNEWATKDITNMVKQYRNSPSVVMWSIGNEVPSQWGPDGVAELTMLQNLVKSLDNTRPVTCGMDQIGAVLDNGFAASLDIPGFNYKPQYYERAYKKLPQKMILGSETASTVSSRGVYHFPVSFEKEHNSVLHPDNQSSSYDNETCDWSNTPDIDFYMDEQPWVIGQFVWTGFDYLGEPSPYDTDAWPSHSSVFGIVDLASLPKDRYYLYRSHWNKNDATLHVLPHWNWKGREGQITPVFVYTSYPKAELFINGKSQGMKEKNDSTLQTRYRLMWNETVYEPGELKVVAYDADGNKTEEKIVRTAGKPHHLILTPNRGALLANGDDLAYITIQVADKDGNIVPTDNRKVKFTVSGAGTFEATANGDPTSLMPFQNPEMNLFSGAATAIVRSADKEGEIRFTASAKGIKPATVSIQVK